MTLDSPKIQLDPWRSDYGGELLPETPGVEEPADVRLDAETDEAWVPRTPAPLDRRPRLVFVDGVRRVDARLVVHRPVTPSGEGVGPPVLHGVAASLAVGAVELTGSSARFVRERVRRLLVLPASVLPSTALEPAPGLVYEPVASTAANGSHETGESHEAGEPHETGDPEATDDAERTVGDPTVELQRQMQRTEAELVVELGATAEDRWVIADGPLRFGPAMPARAVGYIKRSAKLHLPATHLEFLARLPVGGRTPLFVLAGRGHGFPRLSWYLRLAAPAPAESDLGGLARLEVAEAVGLETAVALADASCGFLPPLGSRPFEDPRAPQNLVPIAALERRLKHALGDAGLVRRHLAASLAEDPHPLAPSPAFGRGGTGASVPREGHHDLAPGIARGPGASVPREGHHDQAPGIARGPGAEA